MSSPRITLYSSRGCTHCRQARRYLQQAGLRFREFDVQRDPRALKAFTQLGGRGVPLIMIGEQRIDGFDKRRLDRLLAGDSRR